MASISGSSATVTDDGTTVTLTLASVGPQGPAGPAPEWGNITGTLGDQTDLNSALAGKTDDADLPYSDVITGVVQPNAASGGVSQFYGAGYIYNALSQWNGLNVYTEWSVFVAAGTYTLRTAYLKNTNAAIWSISIDGGAALGTTIDTYNASLAPNNITDITGIALTAGRHVIRYTGTSKNASSSGYWQNLHGFSLTRTGA
jgi:hypothetical protein